MRRVVTAVGCALVLGIGAACGSSDPAATGGSGGRGTGGSGGTGTGGSAPTVSTFSVVVFDALSDGTKPQPALAGVTVVFDKPGGERVEKVTGADGTALFEDIDWALGKATATILPDAAHAMNSFTNLDPDSAVRLGKQFGGSIVGSPKVDLAIYTWMNDTVTPATVALGGAVANLATGNSFVVSAVGALGALSQGTGATYALRAEKAKPLTLLGIEAHGIQTQRTLQQTFVRWLSWDQPAITADTTLDLDLNAATPLTSTTVSGKIVIPGGATGPLGTSSISFVNVRSLESVQTDFFGGPVKSAPAADLASFEYQVEFAQPAGLLPVSMYYVGNSDGSNSARWKLAYPQEGEVTADLLELPPALTGPVPLYEPISFPGTPAGSTPRLTVIDAAGAAVWSVTGTPGDTSFTLAPPNAAGAARLATAKKVVLMWLGDPNNTTNSYMSASQTKKLSLKM